MSLYSKKQYISLRARTGKNTSSLSWSCLKFIKSVLVGLSMIKMGYLTLCILGTNIHVTTKGLTKLSRDKMHFMVTYYITYDCIYEYNVVKYNRANVLFHRSKDKFALLYFIMIYLQMDISIMYLVRTMCIFVSRELGQAFCRDVNVRP